MGISTPTGDSLSSQEQTPAVEYKAVLISQMASGEVRLTIGAKSLSAFTLFDAVEIPYSQINKLELRDYVVTIWADSGCFTLSRLGSWCQPFCDLLTEAYNKAVLRSLFVSGSPLLTAKGEFSFCETGGNYSSRAAFANGNTVAPGDDGKVAIHVYENCAVALPPDLFARRVPLCFTTGFDKGDYITTLKLEDVSGGTGIPGEAGAPAVMGGAIGSNSDNYSFAKLGYETTPFNDTVEKQLRKQREDTIASVRDIDSSLTTVQYTQLARMVPQGAAAPVGMLVGIAPSFVSALESKIATTRAAESYRVFKEMCDQSQIWVGSRKNEGAWNSGEAMLNTGAAGGTSLNAGECDSEETSAPDPYLLWIIAPSPDGRYAAVEFAEANSATFVYKTGGDFSLFARRLNRALEAIAFRREAIWISDNDLRKPENADYYMAAKRITALQFVRSCFYNRIIHSSVEGWRRKLSELWEL